MEYVGERYIRGRLLDVGCGEKPWKSLFAQYADEHIGVDHAETIHDTSHIDIVADAYSIPLEACSIDTVVLNEVIEHLERPQDALSEAYRLLKPGGHIIVDTPFFWPIHEAPRDFYRYSPHGLNYLLESAGFEVIEILPLSGAWVTVALEVSYAWQDYRRGPLRPAVDVAIRLIQWMATRWEIIDFQPRFSCVHVAVGRKPPTRILNA
jgi:ubiquinone/menaquinone biosynthesis C-methylase UbiE